MSKFRFVMAGGGTGGHVFPSLAVAEVLRARQHDVQFIGTRRGIEARLAPEHGYPISYIRIGGLNRVGLRKTLQSLIELPVSVIAACTLLARRKPHAIFSMGGYVAGPVMIAAKLLRIPIVIMEPNAVPGMVNRRIGKGVYRALVAFDAAKKWFPANRVETSGLPVRAEFFAARPKAEGQFTVVITGGSRGSRSINRASRESWGLFRSADSPIRVIHQAGAAEYDQMARNFSSEGLSVEVVPFIDNMAEAFRSAHLVVSRSGAGAVAEIAAAAIPSILIPLPFAADDHQRKNAEALVQSGAARMILDKELSGDRLYREIEDLRTNPAKLEAMQLAVRPFAKPDAAQRAADVLEEAAARKPTGSHTSNREEAH